MSQREVVEKIKTRLPDIHSDVIRAVITTFGKVVLESERVAWPNFGVFKKALRKSRPGRNPKTGVEFMIPDKIVTIFKASKPSRAKRRRMRQYDAPEGLQ